MSIDKIVIAVVGLGYVGLPLAIEFGKKYKTVGYDLSETKINNYKKNFDPTAEVALESFLAAKNLVFTANSESIAEADFIVIAVPTPVDDAHIPDFSPLTSSSLVVGKYMKKGAIVVYESTVYPGATEDICIPILERESGMVWKKDFYVGYSPERINPGDKEHTLTKILKVVSADTDVTLETVAMVYESIISAGVHRATSIKVAEAAKVIENTQRDLNIALMNELALIFDRIGIDTTEVLEAAGTKWNFLKFKPGLVGGHCIGVDPYYLTHKAVMLGYHPEVILAGRKINDGMGKFIAEKTIKLMIQAGTNIRKAKVIVLGLTFKENCPDLRNSKVPDIIRELGAYGVEVFIHDPLANKIEALEEYDLEILSFEELPENVDAIILAVPHQGYCEMPVSELLHNLKDSTGSFVDVKASLPKESLPENYWRL
ncbi:WecC UDP-N-acetyl-D-mannosaminuronate dehydrogenase [Candidatus Methylopumilus universalis]|uniref:nucleotide sugar dehydrogenase n=1 Tax=Candidatus Methylopumilus universalis TaxID=2588536 RepID=UPI003BEED4EF